MKQKITLEQFKKLSNKGKGNLLLWQREKHYDSFDDIDGSSTLASLPIGQMIEFLLDHGYKPDIKWTKSNAVNLTVYPLVGIGGNKDELCNALWMAVKEVLERE